VIPAEPARLRNRELVMTPTQAVSRWLRVIGAGLLAATGAIHLDLYLTGYRSIPVIGWMFLAQVIAAFALALVIPVTSSRVVAAAGAGLAICALGGYLLSLWTGLFGFTEVRTTAGLVAGIIEVAAFGALAVEAVSAAPGSRSPAHLADRVASVLARHAGPAAAAIVGVTVVALALLGADVAAANGAPGSAAGLARGGAGSAGAGATPAGAAGNSHGALRAARVGGVTVLTNGRGFTLYWFGRDTASASKCTGTCTAYWPPVRGPVTAGPGVLGKLGTITRPGGSLQATYDGHPLYGYVGDTAPGQARGNGLDLNGGVWHEMLVRPS
jgi:predicted lipoprotein with Yx(FWY)xxD motif